MNQGHKFVFAHPSPITPARDSHTPRAFPRCLKQHAFINHACNYLQANATLIVSRIWSALMFSLKPFIQANVTYVTMERSVFVDSKIRDKHITTWWRILFFSSFSINLVTILLYEQCLHSLIMVSLTILLDRLFPSQSSRYPEKM